MIIFYARHVQKVRLTLTKAAERAGGVAAGELDLEAVHFAYECEAAIDVILSA